MQKISKSFFRFFGKSTGHNGLKIRRVCHFIIVCKCYFIKISVSWKKSKTKVVPQEEEEEEEQQQQQQHWLFHGLGFAADKNGRHTFVVTITCSNTRGNVICLI